MFFAMFYHFVFLAFLSGFFCSDVVSGYWRMSCMGVVGRGRIDPIVSPNNVSEHLHTLKGASGKFADLAFSRWLS